MYICTFFNTNLIRQNKLYPRHALQVPTPSAGRSARTSGRGSTTTPTLTPPTRRRCGQAAPRRPAAPATARSSRSTTPRRTPSTTPTSATCSPSAACSTPTRRSSAAAARRTAWSAPTRPAPTSGGATSPRPWSRWATLARSPAPTARSGSTAGE